MKFCELKRKLGVEGELRVANVQHGGITHGVFMSKTGKKREI